MRMFFLFILFSSLSPAADLSDDYRKNYSEGELSAAEIATLKNTEIVLIPGIMSETFIDSDHRSRLDFSFLTRDYFGFHLRYLKDSGIPARRLLASSASVIDTKKEINDLLGSSVKPVIFIGHSLGGMALLDHLLENDKHWEKVAGIVFLQSPFTGAPMAEVVANYPFLQRIFPIVHTSKEVVRYLSPENRKDFVRKQEVAIKALTAKIRTITVGGIINGYKSVFSPSSAIIRTGCLETVRGRCVGPRFYRGPYDDSDGMVPFQSSLLPEVDFIRLPGVDHGETVVQSPYKNISHRKLTSALLKFFL